MFAYGIARAVNRGWIDATNMVVARRAFAGIAKQVTPDGAVNGTCEGTGIGETLDFYIKRRQPANDSHGRGPVLLAGTEILLAGKK
jgi:rhamnogalacturonyl hydrolase YesR